MPSPSSRPDRRRARARARDDIRVAFTPALTLVAAAALVTGATPAAYEGAPFADAYHKSGPPNNRLTFHYGKGNNFASFEFLPAGP